MDISIIGIGYVGLPAGAGFASKDHEVKCVDIDEEKVEKINNGECPIYEEGLPELLEEVVGEGKLEATTDTRKAVKNSDITFLAVGTPKRDDGSINLEYIEQAAIDVAEAMKDKDGYHLVVLKSTIVPTTTEDEIIPILESFSGKEAGKDFGVCMNPEFLREGTALQDFLQPDRIVIGELDEKSGDMLEEVYEGFDAPVMRTSLKAAEMIKYASNSLLATKISFINEIGELCKELDIDVYEVADGVGMDSRVERSFLNASCGFGGSCFPKDVRALINVMKEEGVDPGVLENVIERNQKQKKRKVELLEQKMDLEGARVAVLGLSFKPGTDDIRESPAIDIIHELKKRGAEVHAHDPKAIENMKQVHPEINYTETAEEALEDAHAALITKAWDEFHELKEELLPEITIEGDRLGKGEGICWP